MNWAVVEAATVNWAVAEIKLERGRRSLEEGLGENLIEVEVGIQQTGPDQGRNKVQSKINKYAKGQFLVLFVLQLKIPLLL